MNVTLEEKRKKDGLSMTYLEAESMRQEFNVALQYQEMFPDKYKEVVKKYTADQWVEFGKAVLTKLEDDKVHLFELLAIVEMILKEERAR